MAERLTLVQNSQEFMYDTETVTITQLTQADSWSEI